MAINPEHIPLYQEAFKFLKAKVQPLGAVVQALVIGYQEILKGSRDAFPFLIVTELFQEWGWNAVELDLYDKRADTQSDLNYLCRGFNEDLVFDIGTLEHIADSQMALENYLDALRVGGYLFLLTPCRGYFDHGLHTFSPEYILETLKQNGCEIEKTWYALPEWKGGMFAEEMDQILEDTDDCLIVVIARLTREFKRPIKPIQQKRWMK